MRVVVPPTRGLLADGWLQRAAQVVVLGLLLAYALTYVLFSDPLDAQSRGADFSAYWDAAVRVGTGQPLYPPVVDQQANDVYRYSAWFAYALSPFTGFPKELVETLWIASMGVAAAYLIWTIARTRTLAAVALLLLLGPWLFENAWVGQVQLLVVAGIAATLHRPAGPIVIGIAASLKLTPLVFAAYYALERQWWRFVISIAVFLVLAVPTLAVDLSHYPTAGSEIGLGDMPLWLWAVATAALVVAASLVAYRWPRFRLLALGVIAIVVVPRVHHISASYVLPALSERQQGRRPPER